MADQCKSSVTELSDKAAISRANTLVYRSWMAIRLNSWSHIQWFPVTPLPHSKC